ncbi:MAG TPA: DMT family transporter [Thermoplasmata archaeon]|nr:DMT family transporter [Thermoplasmata archaeon]
MGETAALATALLWTTCSILFASAGRRIGSLSVNAWRILMAAGLLGMAHMVLFGMVLPDASREQYAWLALSGVVGLALGDLGYFGCLVCIGPRRGVLLMSMAPIFTAVTAWIWLGEVLAPWTIAGIALVLVGVFITVAEGGTVHDAPLTGRRKVVGVALGLAGSVGQGVGLVISKYGMIGAAPDPEVPLDPLSATLIRMVTACVFIWAGVAVTGRLRGVLAAGRDLPAISRTFGGALSGPFVGVWLSMVAVTYTVAGVAATIMATMPILVIPVVWVLYGERTSWRGIAGAVLAFSGVAVLFLV